MGITGKSDVNDRWKNGHGYRNNIHFHNAIRKYGWDNIHHEIVCRDVSKEEAENIEIELIERYHSNLPEYGYNISSGGHSNTGYKHSTETKSKISKSLYGHHVSQDTKCKISKSHVGKPGYWSGKKLSKERREKISRSLVGNIPYNAIRIVKKDCNNVILGVYNSATEAAQSVGGSHKGVLRCCRNQTSSYMGFMFEFAS